ncbi:hypothetical protein DUI87_15903 [Hirundo rustica rustica]|uniref:Rna-directed dna polymerase from mobile element jockey-like n=1 Tax=Hirundo rustica rustica TaxID=333673 RepID=A0A3M0K0I0_HIRRU|nr:hypothetical protein DUI87_15903 [Hirundo rustica rustica]
MDNGSKGSHYPELEDHDCKNDQISVDPEIVHDLLLQLDCYKSMGPDGIHPRALKEMADIIIKSLLMIFEPSWESGDVPADWKLTNIVTAFRKGKKEDLETTGLSVSLQCLLTDPQGERGSRCPQDTKASNASPNKPDPISSWRTDNVLTKAAPQSPPLLKSDSSLGQFVLTQLKPKNKQATLIQPTALQGIALAKGLDPALGLGLPAQLVQVPLQSLPTLQQMDTLTQFGVIHELANRFDPFIQIIRKDIKQEWAQHGSLGDPTSDWMPAGRSTVHRNS